MIRKSNKCSHHPGPAGGVATRPPAARSVRGEKPQAPRVGVSLKGATWCCLYVTLPRGDGWSEDGRGGSRDRTRSPQIEVS